MENRPQVVSVFIEPFKRRSGMQRLTFFKNAGRLSLPALPVLARVG